MFSSVPVDAHESKQLEEEASGKRKGAKQPSGCRLQRFPLLVCREHASAKRLDTLQEVSVPEFPAGHDSQNKERLEDTAAVSLGEFYLQQQAMLF